ncbi:MAG: hypothetical protein JWN36_3069 [Microbacteriaceae bacterium]|nr:hypothetical protein [Microbacteriaceae bacterium]
MTTPDATADREHRQALAVARVLVGVGIGVTVLAFLALVATVVLISAADARPLDPVTGDPAPLYLIADDGTPAARWIVIAPGGLLLVAACLVIFGELIRRGAWTERETTLLEGGSNVVDLVALPLRAHIAWLCAAVLAWCAVIAVPSILQSVGSWPGTLSPTARDAVWFVLALNGAFPAGLAAASAVSLLKKRTFDARAERGRATIREGSPAQRFWRLFSHRWRAELWIAAVAGAFAGSAPVAATNGAGVVAAVLLAIGVVLGALSVALALNAWRSGESLRRVESVA